MRKGLTILGALFIIIIVFSETLLPWLARETLQTRMNERLSTTDAQVAVDSSPGFLFMLGQVQQMHAVAHQAKVGNVYFREISLSGENMRLNVGDLLQAGKVALRSADKLVLKGVVDEENLQEALPEHRDDIVFADILCSLLLHEVVQLAVDQRRKLLELRRGKCGDAAGDDHSCCQESGNDVSDRFFHTHVLSLI